MRTIFLLLFLALLAPTLLAQTDRALLRELAEENKKSVEALALYPADTRLAILESAKHPEILIKMKGLRDKTGAAFRTLIEDFPQAQQAVFYDLTRYPGLIKTLSTLRGDEAAQREALVVLPENQRETTLDLLNRHPNLVAKLAELSQTTDQAFEKLIIGYPAPAKQAFRSLSELPEVLDILNEDLRFTVLVGDLYQENPAWVLHQVDSLNLAVARTQAAAFDDWKTTLENDPEAQEELRSVAREYADEFDNSNEYDDLYAGPYNPDYVMVERRYYERPYSWWYGYPWWQPVPRWRPYPWWWDSGWYWEPQGIVIVYMPSYHFMHWYFDRPYHHYQYNHLSTHFVNHYHGWRRSGTTITMGVGEWQDRNRNIISDDWVADKNKLPERLKEYGRFEEKRQEFNRKNPDKIQSPDEFLVKNPRKYPELERSKTKAGEAVRQETGREPSRRSDWAPSKEPVKVDPQPARQPRPAATEPVRKPTPVKPDQKKPTEARPKTNAPETSNDYHKQKWEEVRRDATKQPSAPTRTPAPKAPVKTKKIEKPGNKRN